MTFKPFVILFLYLIIFLFTFNDHRVSCSRSGQHNKVKRISQYEGRLYKGNRNAIYLIDNGAKRLIPDFYTFSKMGFNVTSIEKVSDDFLTSLPMGEPIKTIPVFRPEDYMYHKECEDSDRMVC
jgi:hypothetical protein